MEYYWYQRAKCGVCGAYIWTTDNNQSVVCACNESRINQGQLELQAQTVTDENEFVQFVINDTHRNDLTIQSAL